MAASSCPVCGAASGEPFFEQTLVPVLSNLLCHTREGALAVPRGDIRLQFCRECGLIHNGAFDSTRIRYDVEYENALHFSESFRSYLDELVRDLVERHDLRGKDVVEIGCGDGQFLALLCRSGGNRGIGFDPAHDGGRADWGEDIDVRVIAAQFPGDGSIDGGDFTCCRHVLEHVARPLEFLSAVREFASRRPSGVVFFEVPSGLWTIEDLGIWDVIYEHCLYFTPPALELLFRRAGFERLQLGSAYGGQFLTIEGVPADEGEVTETPIAADAVAPLEDKIERFAIARRAKVAVFGERLAAFGAGRVVLWGAGSKGVTFLNEFANVPAISGIVDLSPRKQGCYVAGTGHQVLAPTDLVADPPSLVIVMNPLYRDEIARELERLGVRTELDLA